MAVRKSDPDPAAGTITAAVVGELFEMWRHLLTWAYDATVALLRPPTPAKRPESVAHWLHRREVVWLGTLLLASGVTAGVLLAEPGFSRTLAAWAGFQSVLWAAARWLLVRYATPGSGRNGAGLLGATSFGLVAYGLALTPELRAVAWAASATLTWVALVLLGSDRRVAARTVSIAWGAQALVVTGSWVARGGVLALLLSRG